MINSDFESREDIMRLARDKGFKVGAEIGVSKGKFSERICQIIPDVRLYCVDPYMYYEGNARQGSQEQHNKRFEEAQERLKPYKVRFIKETSLEASRLIPDNHLDFVFIDGNHSFDHTMLDLILWYPKVKQGGIISGHDYYSFKGAGVMLAVNTFIRAHNRPLHLTTGKGKHNSRDDKMPSFWFIK